MGVAEKFFRVAVGSSVIRTKTIDWNALSYTPSNLDELDSPFTEQELFQPIKELPSEKASGPDRFIGIFYKKMLGYNQVRPLASTHGLLQSQDLKNEYF